MERSPANLREVGNYIVALEYGVERTARRTMPTSGSTTEEQKMEPRNPSRRPTHPGELPREDVLPALGLSVARAAELLGVSRQTLHRVVAESQSVTPEMAVRLGKFCGNGAAIWLALQQERDLWQAERDLASELAKIRRRRVRAAA